MPIEPGANLLHYTLVDKIGEGGMGVVWRATDTSLGRDVAIKILPQAFAEDADRLARFEREAKLLASLNHPNIAAVYGLHQAGDTRFLAMELVEGEDLQRQLERGAIPVDQAIDIAVQMAAGVEAAHEKGVVHRDLKPANVVRAPDGSVKVLDFGLAKSFGDSAGGTDLSTSPTITSMGTVAGVILGTASYMSPEQARGQAVDQRTDVWAFGCVLFELLSGTRPFGGDTLTDVLAAIVRSEPDWDALSGEVPEGIIALIKRCLRKNLRERLRSVGDIGLTLKELADETAVQAPAQPAAVRRGLSSALAAGLLVAVAVVAGGVGYWLSHSEPTVEPPRRFNIQLAEGVFLPAGVGRTLAVSRDGTKIVYLAEDLDQRRLYIRGLNDFKTRPLPGTEGSRTPFFSPDGEWVGFGTDEGLSKISLSSLETYPICENCSWGSWGDDGNVVFARESVLWRVSATGGVEELLVDPAPDKDIPAMVRPMVLPGSKVVLFEIGHIKFGGVGVFSVESGEILPVSSNGASPFYSPTGHIVFGRDSTLFAVPFDAERFEITGRETHVLQGVRVENAGALQAAVSETGMLVYAPSGATMGTQLTWVDREGNSEAVNDQWRLYTHPRISPDGERLAVVVINGGKTDIWIVDLASGGMAPLTTSGTADSPIWTPDGAHVTFADGIAPPFAMRSMSVESSGQQETLFTSDHDLQPEAWHPDGNLLVYAEESVKLGLFVFDASSETRAPMFDGDIKRFVARLSPDGKHMSYMSDKTGVYEVYVTSFPVPGAEMLVSIGGAGGPLWSPDGSGLFYRDERRYTSVLMDGLRVTSRDPAFDAFFYWWGDSEGHADLHPDGERFVVLQKNEALTRPGINVVLNWFAELEQRAPADR